MQISLNCIKTVQTHKQNWFIVFSTSWKYFTLFSTPWHTIPDILIVINKQLLDCKQTEQQRTNQQKSVACYCCSWLVDVVCLLPSIELSGKQWFSTSPWRFWCKLHSIPTHFITIRNDFQTVSIPRPWQFSHKHDHLATRCSALKLLLWRISERGSTSLKGSNYRMHMPTNL